MRRTARETVVLAADHGGVAVKADLKAFLEARGIAAVDLGTRDAAPVDYPDYGFAAAAAIRRGEARRAVIVCKSGIGMAIAANKSAGVRAALVATPAEAALARRHNDANVLVLGAAGMPPRRARRIVAAWLDATFEGGRHRRRIDKIRRFERAHWVE